MDEVWVLWEDEAPNQAPRIGFSVEISARWHPEPEFLPASMWSSADDFDCSSVDRGVLLTSRRSSLSAVMPGWAIESGPPPPGVLQQDRYLWIDTDFSPSFTATIAATCLVCVPAEDFSDPRPASAIVVTDRATPPEGFLILHRYVKVTTSRDF